LICDKAGSFKPSSVVIYIISLILLLFSSGEDVQRASVIINLPFLVRQNPAETFRRVVPKVRVGQTMFLLLFGFEILLRLPDMCCLWMVIQNHTLLPPTGSASFSWGGYAACRSRIFPDRPPRWHCPHPDAHTLNLADSSTKSW